MPKPQQTYILTKGVGKISVQAEDSKRLTSLAKKEQQKNELRTILKRSRLTERDIVDSIDFLNSWLEGEGRTNTKWDKFEKILISSAELAANIAQTSIEMHLSVQDVGPVIRLPDAETLRASDAAGILAATIALRHFVVKVWRYLNV